MKCEFCERTFQNWPYERVIRGKHHLFCGEGCFNLWRYKYPKFDMNEMYRECTYPIPAEIINEAIREANA